MTIGPAKESPQPLRGDIDFDVVQVNPDTGLIQRGLAQVSGQDLDGRGLWPAIQVLEKGHGQRVDLLPGGTACHPKADHSAGRSTVDERWEYLLFKGFERFRIAEELGHADQEVAI